MLQFIQVSPHLIHTATVILMGYIFMIGSSDNALSGENGSPSALLLNALSLARGFYGSVPFWLLSCFLSTSPNFVDNVSFPSYSFN